MSARPAVRYRWEELPDDRPMDLLRRRRVIGEQAMLSEVLLEKGCFVPTHQHENEQFCICLRGRIRFRLGDGGSPGRGEVVLQAGDVLHLPSSVPHSAEAIEETLVIDVFSPPSQKTGIDRA